MSETPSSPYKSKLFNFLNRQTIRVKEQVERTVRQAKVAATWGVQVVMYPIYLIFQTTRYASYRFQQTAQQNWKRLQPTSAAQAAPEVDAPIQQVLDAIAQLELNPASVTIASTLNSSVTVVSDSASAIVAEEIPRSEIVLDTADDKSLATIGGKLGHRGVIGVASQLETRQLVLVAPSYEILDILTPDQQHKLRQRIIWEIAAYKHNWRLWALFSQGFSPKIAPRRKINVLPPVRWLWQTMAWLQGSEVAMAIDLFQESRLTPVETNLARLPLVPPQIAHVLKELEIPGMAVVEQQINSLDLAIAKAETYLLSQPSFKLTVAASNSQIVPEANQSAIRSRDNSIPATRDSFSLQKLVLAAIDYFFGQNRNPNLPDPNYRRKLPQNPNLALPANYTLEELDPWLSWDEFFPEPPISDSPFPERRANDLPPRQSTYRAKLPEKNTSQPKLPAQTELPQKSLWNTVKSFFRIDEPEIPKNLARAGSRAIQADDESAKITGNKMGEAIATSSNSPSLEYTPNWIETEATPKGYVKHPFQKLLEWLDRIVLSIEDWCSKIYQGVKSWFKN